MSTFSPEQQAKFDRHVAADLKLARLRISTFRVDDEIDGIVSSIRRLNGKLRTIAQYEGLVSLEREIEIADTVKALQVCYDM